MSDDQTKFSVGLVQMALSKNQNENLDKAVSKIEEAAKMGAEVICLPELFRSQYFCQLEDTKNFDLAETIPGTSTKTISKIANDKNVVVIVPLFEKRSAGSLPQFCRCNRFNRRYIRNISQNAYS